MSYSVVFARHNRNRFVVAVRPEESQATAVRNVFSRVAESRYPADMKGGTFRVIPTSLVRNLKFMPGVERHLAAEALLHG